MTGKMTGRLSMPLAGAALCPGNELIRRADVGKESIDQVVTGWLDSNEARWKAWFE